MNSYYRIRHLGAEDKEGDDEVMEETEAVVERLGEVCAENAPET